MSLIGEAYLRIRAQVDPGFARDVERQVTPALRRAERAAADANTGVSQFGRVSTSAFGQLTRAAALAGGALLGGAGVVYALKSTVAAAVEAEVSATQLANALERQGISFEDNRAAIDRRVQAMSQMAGIDDELIQDTFVRFVRRTNDVTKALNLQAIAVNVARGRNLSLADASQLVLKASLGMAGQLRRVGIEAKAGASATELLELLQRKYAGSAEAYGRTAAGAQERFKVALENTQEIIGQAVLPAITRLLNRLSDWLNDTDNQKRVQEGVNKAVEIGGKTVEVLAGGYDKARRATNWLREADPFSIGRFRDLAKWGGASWGEVEELVKQLDALAASQKRVAEGFAAIEAARQEDRFTRVFDVPLPSGGNFVGRPLTAAEQRALALAGTGGTGTQAEVAAITAELEADRQARAFAQRKIDAQEGNTRAFFEARERLEREIRAGEDRLAGIRAADAQAAAQRAAAAEQARQDRLKAIADAAQERIDILELAVARAALTKTTADDVRAQQALADELRRQIAVTKDNTGLQQQLVQVQQEQLDARNAATEKRIAAQAEEQRKAIEASVYAIEQLGETLERRRDAQRADDARRAAATEALTQVPERLRLRTQIAEQVLGADEQERLIPHLQREADALTKQLAVLRKGNSTEIQRLSVIEERARIRRRIRDIKAQGAKDSGFTLTEFFAAITADQAMYGGDVGAGTPLSPQDARGSLAGIVRPNPTIHQHFYGEQPNPAQALQQASQAARALR